MLLYHINLGWPLVDEGAQFVAPIVRTRWSTDSVREQGISHQGSRSRSRDSSNRSTHMRLHNSRRDESS